MSDNHNGHGGWAGRGLGRGLGRGRAGRGSNTGQSRGRGQGGANGGEGAFGRAPNPQQELDALESKLKTVQSLRERYPARFDQEISAREHDIETRRATKLWEALEQRHADERRIIAEITAKSEEMQRARTQQQKILQPSSIAKPATQQQGYAEARTDSDAANLKRAMIELAIANGAQLLAQLLQKNAAIAAELERLKAEQEEDEKNKASVDVDMEESNEDSLGKSPRCDVDME